MNGSAPAWRSRIPLLAVLSALLLANVAILVGYRLYYKDRFHSLQGEEETLRVRRDDARAALARTRATQERVSSVQKAVDSFLNETIGTRSERLASVVEEVYAVTRKAGLRPSTIAYAETTDVGVDSLRITFQVDGRYADIKRLLAAFESSPQFFVVENISVNLDPAQPDVLHVGVILDRFFRESAPRPGAARAVRRAREVRPGTTPGTPAASAQPGPPAKPAQPVPPAQVPAAGRPR